MSLGPWIRIEILEALGSTPRDEGVSMLVSEQETKGTIGGGALEYRAIARAREMLAGGDVEAQMDLPLGPALNQCCGGFVKLRLLEGRGMVAAETRFPLVLYGGGHVGTALARALEPLPFAVNWIDARDTTPADQVDLVEVAKSAPNGSLHYVMTHDHQLDLQIVDALLRRSPESVPFVGLIGSKSKAARFHTQLQAAGLSAQALSRLVCPIGIAGIRGKEPEVIAASVAAEALLLRGRFSS